jgi:glycosyltransferase involved in cell wall biosynthesis
MRAMGVDVHIFNLRFNREVFEQNHPDLDIPIHYGSIDEIPEFAARFDAVIATLNISVAWLAPARLRRKDLILGYYVQGYEPLIYPEGSIEYRRAVESYTLIPEMVLFSKTDWTRQQVNEHTGASCSVVGVSVDTELYRPRPRIVGGINPKSIRIGAMVRPETAYRSPMLTMQVLQKASWHYGPKIECLIFGIDPKHRDFMRLPIEFAWKAAGPLHPRQVARFVNELDIFVDFSSHQAMGLTALEAMACGATAIVPKWGGATEFARHGENSLVIDTSSSENCWQALSQLIEDDQPRSTLQHNALKDVCQLYPELPAYNILKALFGKAD